MHIYMTRHCVTNKFALTDFGKGFSALKSRFLIVQLVTQQNLLIDADSSYMQLQNQVTCKFEVV
jgi:hypothetical protein